MGKGKYSPSLTREDADRPYTDYCYNADGQIPPETWTEGEYCTRLHFANYDKCGYDRYGYSAFDADGNYIGIGDGIDRWGYTEMDYITMSDEEFNDICTLYG
jgi:hypothetical protein